MSSRWALLAAALLGGCGRFSSYSWAELTDPDVVTHLEFQVRPDRLHTWLFQFPPDECVTDTKGDRTIAEGPCEVDSDDDGAWDSQWSGVVERRIVGDKTEFFYTDLVVRYPVACSGDEDTFTITLTEGLATDWVDGSFDVEVGGAALLRCSGSTDPLPEFDYTFDVRYHGAMPNHDNDQVWEGDGKYADSEVGLVEADTTDFHGPQFEADCALEPETGVTTLSTPDHEAVLTFDGATACDQSVPWTLDGEDQPPLVPMVGCSTAPQSMASCGIGLLGAIAGLTARRRARPRPNNETRWS